MPTPQFNPGFRLSPLDITILIVGVAASAYTTTIDFYLGIAIAFVVLHFFLFCNILRMVRPLELIWAAIFVALAAAAIAPQLLTWPAAFAIASAVTLILALIQLRLPSYHGILWQKLNPRLPEWWHAKTRTPPQSEPRP